MLDVYMNKQCMHQCILAYIFPDSGGGRLSKFRSWLPQLSVSCLNLVLLADHRCIKNVFQYSRGYADPWINLFPRIRAGVINSYLFCPWRILQELECFFVWDLAKMLKNTAILINTLHPPPQPLLPLPLLHLPSSSSSHVLRTYMSLHNFWYFVAFSKFFFPFDISPTSCSAKLVTLLSGPFCL